MLKSVTVPGVVNSQTIMGSLSRCQHGFPAPNSSSRAIMVPRPSPFRRNNPAAVAASPMCTTSASAGDATGHSTGRAKQLAEIWPLLRRRFREMADDNGHFPLRYTLKKEKLQMKKIQNDNSSNSNGKAKANQDGPKNEKQREAAVLVLVCVVDGEPSVLFTKRSARLSAHASEISFPGGHYDDAAGDNDLVDTAVREAKEELAPADPSLLDDRVEILGRATRIPSLNLTPVTPVIGVLWKELDSDGAGGDGNSAVGTVFPGDPSEVDVVFAVPIRRLIESETSHTIPNNRFGIRRAPLYPSEYGKIWGLTAFILRPLLHRLFKPVFVGNDQDGPIGVSPNGS